jgi:hypothetical protein
MPLSYRIVVRTSAEGAVDQRVLDQLRAALGLTRMGRLTDAEDDDFGYREETVGDSQVMINLLRWGDREWSFHLRYLGEPAPPAEYVDRQRAAFRDAFAQAGLDLYEDVQL